MNIVTRNRISIPAHSLDSTKIKRVLRTACDTFAKFLQVSSHSTSHVPRTNNRENDVCALIFSLFFVISLYCALSLIATQTNRGQWTNHYSNEKETHNPENKGLALVIRKVISPDFARNYARYVNFVILDCVPQIF